MLIREQIDKRDKADGVEANEFNLKLNELATPAQREEKLANLTSSLNFFESRLASLEIDDPLYFATNLDVIKTRVKIERDHIFALTNMDWHLVVGLVFLYFPIELTSDQEEYLTNVMREHPIKDEDQLAEHKTIPDTTLVLKVRKLGFINSGYQIAFESGNLPENKLASFIFSKAEEIKDQALLNASTNPTIPRQEILVQAREEHERWCQAQQITVAADHQTFLEILFEIK